MSKILTPNVFITNNESIARRFYTKGDYKTFENLADIPGAFVISGKQNKYLQSLEMSHNFESENNQSLTLEFLDTDGNFEQEFFMHLVNSSKSLLNKVFASDSAADPGLTPVGKGVEAEVVDIYQYSNAWNKIFIAFGTGYLSSDWTDILTFRLYKTNIDISNGLRKYTFKFFSDNSSLFRPRLKFNLEDPNPDKEFLIQKLAGTPINVRLTIAKDKDTLENVLIRLLIKYLSILTSTEEGNIIPIFPKLSKDDKKLWEGEGNFFNYGTNEIEIYGIKLANQANYLANLANNFVKRRGRSPNSDAFQADDEVNKSSKIEKDIYLLESELLNSNIHAPYPDFYKPINKISEVIKSELKSSDDLVVIKENNLKILDFFYKKGLISDPSKGCVVFGLEQMISEYLYRNYIPLQENTNSFDDLINSIVGEFKPTLKIYNENKTDEISRDQISALLDPRYGLDFINTVSKKKMSSNFEEQINLDELSINQDSFALKFSEIFKLKENIFKLFDIPIFINNLKNSNILDIQYLNSETYLAGLTLAIQSNFSLALLAKVNQNIDKVNIRGLNLQSIFDKYQQTLEKVISTQSSSKTKASQFKTKLKKILTYQFYLAKEQGITLSDSPFNVAGTTVTKKDLFEQLQSIKPVQLAKKKDGKIVTREPYGLEVTYTWITGEKIPVIETQLELETRLREQFGEVISQQEVNLILNAARELFSNFESLILKNAGNIDIDKLLLAESIRRLQNEDLQNDFNFSLADQESALTFANLLFTLFNVQTLDDEKSGIIPEGFVFSPKPFGPSQESIAADLWKQLNKFQTKLSLKTLPFFHLCSFRLMNFKPCFVFSKQVTPANTNSNYKNKLDFFSGVYNIIAFKHVISTTECYSQFTLEKNLGNSYRL